MDHKSAEVRRALAFPLFVVYIIAVAGALLGAVTAKRLGWTVASALALAVLLGLAVRLRPRFPR